eukprot:UN25375
MVKIHGVPADSVVKQSPLVEGSSDAANWYSNEDSKGIVVSPPENQDHIYEGLMLPHDIYDYATDDEPVSEQLTAEEEEKLQKEHFRALSAQKTKPPPVLMLQCCSQILKKAQRCRKHFWTNMGFYNNCMTMHWS